MNQPNATKPAAPTPERSLTAEDAESAWARVKFLIDNNGEQLIRPGSLKERLPFLNQLDLDVDAIDAVMAIIIAQMKGKPAPSNMRMTPEGKPAPVKQMPVGTKRPTLDSADVAPKAAEPVEACCEPSVKN